MLSVCSPIINVFDGTLCHPVSCRRTSSGMLHEAGPPHGTCSFSAPVLEGTLLPVSCRAGID